MKLETRKLKHAELDWAAGLTLGDPAATKLNIATFCKSGFLPIFTRKYDVRWPCFRGRRFSPSTNPEWFAGIVKKLQASIIYSFDAPTDGQWIARTDRYSVVGPTPEVAALRLYILFHLGEVVEIPNELVGVVTPEWMTK